MKTDILVEPELNRSEQLFKEIYIYIYMVIHTAYIPCSSSDDDGMMTQQQCNA